MSFLFQYFARKGAATSVSDCIGLSKLTAQMSLYSLVNKQYKKEEWGKGCHMFMWCLLSSCSHKPYHKNRLWLADTVPSLLCSSLCWRKCVMIITHCTSVPSSLKLKICLSMLIINIINFNPHFSFNWIILFSQTLNIGICVNTSALIREDIHDWLCSDFIPALIFSSCAFLKADHRHRWVTWEKKNIFFLKFPPFFLLLCLLHCSSRPLNTRS